MEFRGIESYWAIPAEKETAVKGQWRKGPGMKVLQFAFDSREEGNYLPYTYTRNTVCYTGTHDNETLRQWQEMISSEDLQYALEYLQIEDEDSLPDAMIACGMASVSDLFVAQMQDYLGLGAEARMNKPSTLNDRNWTWRALNDQITGKLTKLYGR